MQRLSLTLAWTLAVVLPASVAHTQEEEEDPPFVVEAVAQVNGGLDGGSDYFERNAVPTAALTPVTAQGSVPGFVSNASATFTQLKVFGSSNDEEGQAGADADTRDTLTIVAVGNPVGTTRLEMTWQIDGTLSGSGAAVNFSSHYRTDAVADAALDLEAGLFEFDTPGPVSQSVTFVYDGVPLGTPWNVRTDLQALVDIDVGEIDFDDTVTLTSVILFVDNQPVSAQVTGASGQVYAVPEPGSLALLALSGLLVARRRRG